MSPWLSTIRCFHLILLSIDGIVAFMRIFISLPDPISLAIHLEIVDLFLSVTCLGFFLILHLALNSSIAKSKGGCLTFTVKAANITVLYAPSMPSNTFCWLTHSTFAIIAYGLIAANPNNIKPKIKLINNFCLAIMIKSKDNWLKSHTICMNDKTRQILTEVKYKIRR